MQSRVTQLAVACLYSLIPAGLALVALPLLWGYPITRERQHELREQIARARAEDVPEPAVARSA